MSPISESGEVLFVQGDVVVTGDDELEFGVGGFEHRDHGLMFDAVADFGKIAAMEEDVGLGEWAAVGI
jgi:hypothetical protein